jgi:hypothetical protein
VEAVERDEGGEGEMLAQRRRGFFVVVVEAGDEGFGEGGFPWKNRSGI